MKKITLEKVIQSLEDGAPTVLLDQDLMRDAVLPLGRMMAIGI
jgi:quinolinate synthase